LEFSKKIDSTPIAIWRDIHSTRTSRSAWRLWNS